MDIQSVFTINGVAIDLANETLRDASGNPIILRPQCFAVLRHLIENADRLVTKDALMAAVWPDTAVTDDSLVQCIHEIRRALGDEDHAVLKTVPKRGYRLALPSDTGANVVAAASPDDISGDSPRGVAMRRPRQAQLATAAGIVLLLIAAAVAWWLTRSPAGSPPADGSPTIAVLPFDNLSEDPGDAYFAAGITEDLITDLSKISGVLVIARNSVWPYKDKSVPAKQVAEDLNVRYVLEGSVRRQGAEIRINAQLIDSVDDHHLWAERYDGTLSDVFALQDKVIANIVSALAVKLTSVEASETGQVETTNPLAYDALLLGLEHLHRETEADTNKAITLFEKAIALDPDYGRAYAAIAAAQLRIALTNWYTTSGAGMDRAYAALRENLAKALERPTSLAYTTAAVWAQQIGRNEEALAFIDKAQALAPNNPDVLVSKALLLNATGRAEEAEVELRRATRLDPGFAPGTLRALSMALHHQEKYQEAIDVVERIKAQGAETTYDYVTLVSSLGQLGRTDGVKEAIDGFNALALPAAFDPMTVQEAQWYWNGDLFDYHRPYVDKMVEGLRKAGVPEGGGMDIPLDKYKGLIKRVGDGEFDVDGATEVDAATAKALRDRGVPFVDARAPLDYANGHVPGAVNLSLVTAMSKEALAKVAGHEDEIAFYCHTKYCSVSAYASAKAVVWGYKRVYRFAGGFPEWKDAGYPIELSWWPGLLPPNSAASSVALRDGETP